MIRPINIMNKIENSYHERIYKLKGSIDTFLINHTPDVILYKNIEELREVIDEYKKVGWNTGWIDEVEEHREHSIRFSFDISPTRKELENIDVIMYEIPFRKKEDKG